MSNTEKILPIVLTQANIANTTTNATFSYKLPGNSSTFKNAELSISQIDIYNSIFNINNNIYNNGTFSIIFPTASTTYTLNISLPNSYMAYSDINNYVEQQMITAGLYLINGSNNVYFWNIQSNSTLYACQINEFSVPTTIGTYTKPPTGIYSSTGTGLPTTAYTPQTVISANGFATLTGILAGTYPATQQITTYSVSSSTAPIINPVQSLNVHCSLCNSDITVPPDYIGNICPSAVQFGGLLSYQPTNYQWISIPDQTVSQITVYFTDQVNNTIYLNDPTTTISLLIKLKNI